MLTEELGNMVWVEGQDHIRPNRKAVVALIPYAVWRERGGDNRMVDACLSALRVTAISMRRFRTPEAPPITTLIREAGPDFPDRAMTLISPHVNWGTANTDVITRWAAAASAVPYTEEVGQSVVDTLLQIAYFDSHRKHIPVKMWAWLKKPSSLPPICEGRSWGTRGGVVRRVRELGDVEILESYFLLVWSEWDSIRRDGFGEIRTSIRADLGGIGKWRHREVLIERLDHVLGQLDMGLAHLRTQNPELGKYHIQTAWHGYRVLKEVLLDMNREALEILTRTPFIQSLNFLTPADVHRFPLDVRLRTPSPVSLVAHPQHLPLVLPTPCSIHASVPLCHSSSSIDKCPTLSIISPTTSRCDECATFTPPVEGGPAGEFSTCFVGFVYTALHDDWSLHTPVIMYTYIGFAVSPSPTLLTILIKRQSG